MVSVKVPSGMGPGSKLQVVLPSTQASSSAISQLTGAGSKPTEADRVRQVHADERKLKSGAAEAERKESRDPDKMRKQHADERKLKAGAQDAERKAQVAARDEDKRAQATSRLSKRTGTEGASSLLPGYMVVVPANLFSGQMFEVNVGGQRMSVRVPAGKGALNRAV